MGHEGDPQVGAPSARLDQGPYRCPLIRIWDPTLDPRPAMPNGIAVGQEVANAYRYCHPGSLVRGARQEVLLHALVSKACED